MPTIEQFSDTAHLNDTQFQEMLRRIDVQDVILALIDADAPTQDAFYRNMSVRVQDFIKEDIEYKKETPAEEINAAKKRIVQIARNL